MHCDWQPKATLATLQHRAKLLKSIRDYFIDQGYLEIQTPCSASASLPEHNILSPKIAPFEHDSDVDTSSRDNPNHNNQQHNKGQNVLLPSAEYYMKRVIAAYGCPIFQIGPCFRLAEHGSRHLDEFTMIEWYKPGVGMAAMQDETWQLLKTALDLASYETIEYERCFQNFLNIDPQTNSTHSLRALCQSHGLVIDHDSSSNITAESTTEPTTKLVREIDTERSGYLDFLFSTLIVPKFERHVEDDTDRCVCVTAFPLNQSPYAKADENKQGQAKRFEFFVNGLELANGCEEENNIKLLKDRLATYNLQANPCIQALADDFPDTSGVAIGFDRLLMLAAKKTNIEEVVSFLPGT